MLPSADKYPMPSLWRILLGLVLAGAVPGVLISLTALFDGDPANAAGFGTFLGVAYGVVPALIFGLPAVYRLRGRVRPTLANAVIGGAILASIPVAPVMLATLPMGQLFASLVLVLAPALLGTLGGAVFWAITLRGINPLNC